MFDAQNERSPYKHQEEYGGISVLFTDVMDTADDYIKNEVGNRGDRTGIIVVTSDRDIGRFAKSNRVKVMSSLGFLKQLLSAANKSDQNQKL